MADVGIYVPVSAVFPGVEPTFGIFRSLLDQLSRTDVLIWCARLNSVLSGPSGLSHADRQQFGLARFLSAGEIDLVNQFCIDYARTRNNLTIFFRGQVLEVMRWAALYCEDHASDGATFENPDVRRVFAKACLIASDLWARRVYGQSLDLSRGVPDARRRALGPLRKGIEGSLTPTELSLSLGRGWTFFQEHIPAIDKSFVNIFETVTGLSVEDYFLCWATVLTNYAKANSETPIFSEAVMGSTTACPEVFQQFVKLESQTVDQLRSALWPNRTFENVSETSAYDYRSIRERPILRTSDGRLILIDPVFCFEKCSIGPLFHALSASTPNHLFELFGLAFERYACEMLTRTFPAGSGALATPLTCHVTDTDARGRKFEIDACLNYVTELIFFEIKAVWGRETELSPENSESLLGLLRQRFSATADSVKGIGQLVRAVNAVVTRQWLGPKNAFQSVRSIRPVLVVHDRLSGSPGFGSFILEEFKAGLEEHTQTASDQFEINGFQVSGPVVLTVEDLELLEVSTERSGFRELLAEYSQWSPDRAQPFASFLGSISGEGRVLANRVLASASMHVLDLAIRRLFPDQVSNWGSESETA
jgi:hypothetical protein